MLYKREYSGWQVDLGDIDVPGDVKGQLAISDAEICAAINGTTVGHKLLGHVLHQRTKAHKVLLDYVHDNKLTREL